MHYVSHTCHYCTVDAKSQLDDGDIQFFSNYFETRKNNCCFPFVIFSDDIPDRKELEVVLSRRAISTNATKPVILAIKKKNTTDLMGCKAILLMGIDDILEWKDRDELTGYLESKCARNSHIADVVESPLVKENLVGSSLIWKKFLCEIVETILFSQASILLIGESGTGKELLSRLIHTLDTRPAKTKLIIVDCTTISPELSGSELFGHERGSYTNAIQGREGAFALANGGTLFLDEIGELPLNLQAELLRVLQEGTFKKIGSNTWQKTSFRLVCATNRNLHTLMEEGKFRQDLFYRVSDCSFRVPGLEERKNDIPDLVNYFFTKLFEGEECPLLDKSVLEFLMRRRYPGNVRELKQLVQRIALKHVGHSSITLGEVPVDDLKALRDGETSITGTENIKEMIRRSLLTGEDWWKLKDRISETAIEVALDLEGYNKQKAAERLGVDVRTVQQYVKRKGQNETNAQR